MNMESKINYEQHKFPFCIVWTPIPLLTWLFPFIGHMGICDSKGVIRDFAGPYFVSNDNMGFGWPTRYLILDPSKVDGRETAWDIAVEKASNEYAKRMHNLFWDNCHSHCGLALSSMRYADSKRWNMIRLAAWMFFFGKYVGFCGFVKSWLPFAIILTIIYSVYFFTV